MPTKKTDKISAFKALDFFALMRDMLASTEDVGAVARVQAAVPLLRQDLSEAFPNDFQMKRRVPASVTRSQITVDVDADVMQLCVFVSLPRTLKGLLCQAGCTVFDNELLFTVTFKRTLAGYAMDVVPMTPTTSPKTRTIAFNTATTTRVGFLEKFRNEYVRCLSAHLNSHAIELRKCQRAARMALTQILDTRDELKRKAPAYLTRFLHVSVRDYARVRRPLDGEYTRRPVEPTT